MPRVYAPAPFRWTDGLDYPFGYFDIGDDSKARAMKNASKVFDDPGSAAAASASSVSGAGNVSGLVSSTTSVASINAALINAALSAAQAAGGGQVSLLIPGTYYVDGADTGILQIPDDTTLYLGPGVLLQGPAGGVSAAKPVVVNSNWRSNRTSVTSITSSTTGSAPFETTCTVLLSTSPASAFRVGGAILIKGDTTGFYNGVWRIASISTTTNPNDTVTFKRYGVSANPAAASGTLLAWPANINVSLTGPGAIDGASNTNNAGSLGDLGRMGCIFNKVGGLTIDQVQMRRWSKYGIYYGNVWGARITAGTMQTQSDGVHAVGPIQSVYVGGVFFNGGDDTIAFTANNTGYTTYDLKDADGTKNSDGDMNDVEIDVQFIGTGGSRNVLIASGQGLTCRRFNVRGVKLTSWWSVSGNSVVLLDSPPAETGSYEDIYISNITGPMPPNTPVISIGASGTTTNNIRNLHISRIGQRGAGNGTTGLSSSILGSSNSTVNITGLTITDIDADVDLANAAANVRAFSFGGGSGVWTVNGLQVSNVKLRPVAASATRSIALLYFGSTGTWDTAELANVIVQGNTSTLFASDSSQAGTGRVLLTNCTQDGDGTNAGQTGVILSGGRNTDIFMSGVNCLSAVSGCVLVYGGSGKTFNINLTGVRCSNRLIVNSGTSHTFNVSESACFSTGVPRSSGNITVGTTSTWNMQGLCPDIGVDVTTIARTDGAMVFNTNAAAGTLGAAGMVISQGTAANSWKRWDNTSLTY